MFGVGKIQDIFDHGASATRRTPTPTNTASTSRSQALRAGAHDVVFTNLVDFDSKYGHRNDPGGYARAIEAFDRRAARGASTALDGGVLLITGDHGCDPTTPPTDHSRERTPLLVGRAAGGPHDIGTRATFGDLGATVAELLGVELGTSSERASTQRSGFGA